MKQLQIHEVVNVYLVLEDDHYAIPSQFHRADLGPKSELADASALVIVPNYDFGRRVLGIGSSSDKSEDIAAEQHLDDLESAAF